MRHFFIAVLGIILLAASAAAQPQSVLDRFDRIDRNRDGKVTPDELPQRQLFQRLDRNGDGVIDRSEAEAADDRIAGRGRAPTDFAGEDPEINTPNEPQYIKHLNLRYAEISGVDPNLLSLDLYVPASEPEAELRPVMIYIHGGGWRRGDKSAVGEKPSYFTSRGFIFVSVNYRLIPDVNIVTQIQDSANAIGWVKKNIARYGGDAARLHLIGHSAGAHHVAILATNERFLEHAGVALRDLRSVVELDTQALDVPELMRGSDNDLYLQAFGKDLAVWKQISPRDNVSKDKGIPPFFLVVANERGPKLAQAFAFQRVLQAAGVRCEFIEAPQHDHGSLNRAIGDQADEVTQAMERFHDSVLGAKESADSELSSPEPVAWDPSLTFDAETTKEGPLPVNAMQLVTHRGMLFCGMATSFERDRYSRGSSYVYSKASTDAPWKLEADFGPGTSRVGQMFSARFEHDEHGRPIAGGPQDVLLAFTMSQSRRNGEQPLQVRVRDDSTGTWHTHDLPTPGVSESNVREVWLHRDRVTGADLLFVAANPFPLGIYTGVFDVEAPGRIRWRKEPEITAQGRRGTSKWFGMATVNGVLFASDVDAVYRRDDGPHPTWTKVLQFPRGQGDAGGAEVRGLTAVPNPQAVTAWPEKDMLLLATQMKLWRMRVPANTGDTHDYSPELDLVTWLGEQLSEPIIFAEAAFNRLTPVRLAPDTGLVWPVGFQVVYPVHGSQPSSRDPDSYRLKDDAWYLLRDEMGLYTVSRIDSKERLFLARDFKPSPFTEEPHTLYACGYNGSYFKGSLGTAWIYRGTVPTKDAR